MKLGPIKSGGVFTNLRNLFGKCVTTGRKENVVSSSRHYMLFRLR